MSWVPLGGYNICLFWFDFVNYGLGGLVCFQEETNSLKKMTIYQFIWKPCKMPICLRDGAEMLNLSCLYSVRSILTWQSQKVLFV
jgi:hypothetical protein